MWILSVVERNRPATGCLPTAVAILSRAVASGGYCHCVCHCVCRKLHLARHKCKQRHHAQNLSPVSSEIVCLHHLSPFQYVV